MLAYGLHSSQSASNDRADRTHSLIDLAPGASAEQEYLFTAYSIFTVRSVAWGAGGAPHRIELDAASDNRVEAEGGEGRWATPAGSEHLPLAPWY